MYLTACLQALRWLCYQSTQALFIRDAPVLTASFTDTKHRWAEQAAERAGDGAAQTSSQAESWVPDLNQTLRQLSFELCKELLGFPPLLQPSVQLGTVQCGALATTQRLWTERVCNSWALCETALSENISRNKSSSRGTQGRICLCCFWNVRGKRGLHAA